MSEAKITNKQRKSKVEKLMIELASNDLKKINVALDSLQVHGDVSILEDLFEIAFNQTDAAIIEAIKEFLSSLKNSDAQTVVMDLLLKTDDLERQKFILSTIWNSPIDYSEYLDEFVQLATEGDFLVALECLTVIENLDGPFSEVSLMETQLLLKEYYEKGEKDDQKNHMISEIALFIKDFAIQEEDDLDD